VSRGEQEGARSTEGGRERERERGGSSSAGANKKKGSKARVVRARGRTFGFVYLLAYMCGGGRAIGGARCD
jgi:hypothetical protein